MRRRLRETEEFHELNIVPYLDIITNLVIFMLLSMTGLIIMGVLTVAAPKIGGADTVVQAQEAETPKLLLTIAISSKGYYIAGSGGVLGGQDQTEGGIDAARPPTIPLKDGKYDYARLTAMMKEVKTRYPDEENLIISADADVVYDVLIQTMDACRGDPVELPDGRRKYSLFPLVSLSLIG